jgi:hypothetical protein
MNRWRNYFNGAELEQHMWTVTNFAEKDNVRTAVNLVSLALDGS